MKFHTMEPTVGAVIYIAHHGNFVWTLKDKNDAASGYWKKMSKREWDKYANEN